MILRGKGRAGMYVMFSEVCCWRQPGHVLSSSPRRWCHIGRSRRCPVFLWLSQVI